jgi:hypothetical protein
MFLVDRVRECELIYNEELQPGEKEAVISRQSSQILSGILLVAVLSMISPSTTMSADNDTRSATGTVVAAITVAATQNLELGNVLQGVPKTMGNDDDDSTAIFTVTGDPDDGINLQFTLPEYLTLSNGSDRMTIIFDATSMSIDTTGTASPSTVVGAFVDKNPRAVPGGVVIGSSGTSKVFLGGKVVPSVNQKAGAYSGDIILSVSYNGT